MFSCNRHETNLIMQGKFGGAVRKYDPKSGCPHKPGSKILVSSKFTRENPGKDTPIAEGMVVSVRPGTVGEFKKNDSLAKLDGFANAQSWYTYFARHVYPGVRDDEQVFHVQMRLTQIEKKPPKTA